MVLELDEEVARVEAITELCERLAPRIGSLVEDLLRDVSAHARAQADDASAVLTQHFQIDAGLVVGGHSVDPTSAHQTHQVLVPLLRAGQQQQMACFSVFGVATISRGKAHLTAEDRFDVGGLTRADQLHRPEHVAVVGERDRRHAHLGDVLGELRNPNGPIEHRELAVHVQVNELGCHRRGDSTVTVLRVQGASAHLAPRRRMWIFPLAV